MNSLLLRVDRETNYQLTTSTLMNLKELLSIIPTIQLIDIQCYLNSELKAREGE